MAISEIAQDISYIETHLTIEGRVLDLTNLTEPERDYLNRAVAAYLAGCSYEYFDNTFVGSGLNPVIHGKPRPLDRSIFEHPLWEAVMDMDNRLGVKERLMSAPAPQYDPTTNPFQDTWLLISAAAPQKGVSVQAIHAAIGRGELIARPIKPGANRLLVSQNSLNAWQVNPTRQAAGQRRSS